jgi:glutamate-1-semialdehyde 2,1-aminomutase
MESLNQAIDDLRSRYTSLNPQSQAADKRAEKVFPGGNTRTILHFDPFPLTMVGGEGAGVSDLDGHDYVDFVGEFSAGLFGHSNEIIKSAIQKAMNDGFVMGAPTQYERQLAGLLCERFPSVDKIRFCNSGTEANLMALTTSRIVTGREKVLAFNDAYHGGVIKFLGGPSAFNVPFDFVLADFNDIEGTSDIINQVGDELAAVIVEPVLGAGGNILADQAFLEMLRQKTKDVGAVLIFDEVKTARLGVSGIQGMMGVQADMTTLGKFIAGGLPTGAFGGSAEIMDRFNPKVKGALAHPGTFNNNVCSMAAGCAAMGQIYTPERAADFFDWSEIFRHSLNELFVAKDVPMYANGLGSMIAIHFSREVTKTPSDITTGCRALRPLLHMEMLLEGVSICGRGDLFLSLPMDETHLSKARDALETFIDRHKALIDRTLQVVQ